MCSKKIDVQCCHAFWRNAWYERLWIFREINGHFWLEVSVSFIYPWLGKMEIPLFRTNKFFYIYSFWGLTDFLKLDRFRKAYGLDSPGFFFFKDSFLVPFLWNLFVVINIGDGVGCGFNSTGSGSFISSENVASISMASFCVGELGSMLEKS